MPDKLPSTGKPIISGLSHDASARRAARRLGNRTLNEDFKPLTDTLPHIVSSEMEPGSRRIR